jgi:hypothetical protein
VSCIRVSATGNCWIFGGIEKRVGGCLDVSGLGLDEGQGWGLVIRRVGSISFTGIVISLRGPFA